MSATKTKRSPAPAPATEPTTPANAITPAPTADDAELTPWTESTDPRKRQIARLILIGLWIYVAALGLLAIDQWFNLGIFGPKMPPLP